MRRLRTVEVSNLPPNTSEKDLGKALSSYGLVERVSLSDGEALVRFQDGHCVEKVLREQVWFQSRKLKVAIANNLSRDVELPAERTIHVTNYPKKFN